MCTGEAEDLVLAPSTRLKKLGSDAGMDGGGGSNMVDALVSRERRQKQHGFPSGRFMTGLLPEDATHPGEGHPSLFNPAELPFLTRPNVCFLVDSRPSEADNQDQKFTACQLDI